MLAIHTHTHRIVTTLYTLLRTIYSTYALVALQYDAVLVAKVVATKDTLAVRIDRYLALLRRRDAHKVQRLQSVPLQVDQVIQARFFTVGGDMQARRMRIPKVRERLHWVAGGDLFTPQAVTIGPYHHHRVGGSPPFPRTDDQKEQAVRVIERLLVDARRDLEGLEQVVTQQEHRVRECYTYPLHPEMVDHHPDRLFSRMLLRDGCYLLSFFISFTRDDDDDDDDGGEQQRNITETTQDNTVVWDILYLLENQVPLFLLDRMYEHIVIGEPTAPPSAVECIAEHVRNLLQRQLYISDNKQPVPEPKSSTCCDLLHLVYSYFRRGQPQTVPLATEQGGGSPTGRWRRAMDYSRHADVRFCRQVFTPGDHGWTILDITYDRGTLYMPLLRVGSSTLTMVRNLMALEEQEAERPVTAYCFLMSQLACTEEDVALLQDAGVLEHFLGSNKQAARGFADLCNGVALDIDNLDRNYLRPIWHQLDGRCRMRVHGFNGIFREQYGSSVFKATAFCVAFVVFVCQVIQVVYAVLAYHRPPN